MSSASTVSSATQIKYLPSQAPCSPGITPLTNYHPSHVLREMWLVGQTHTCLSMKLLDRQAQGVKKANRKDPYLHVNPQARDAARGTGTTCKNTTGCTLQDPQIVPPKQPFPPTHHSLAGSNGATKPSSAQGTHPSRSLHSGPTMLI